jgi:type IV secretory pathway VirB10-like protein
LEAIVVTWRELLVVVILVLAVYIAEMLLMMRAGGALRKPRWLSIIHEKTVEAELRQQLEALTKRVAMIETGIALKASLPTQPLSSAEFDWSVTPTPPIPPSLPETSQEEKVESETAYQRAVKMAQQGGEAQTLVDECGISHSEAELIVSMYKR